MATQSHHLSIVEAVETLSGIADLEFDHEAGIAQKHEIVLGDEKVAYKTVHWLHKDHATATVNLVRETFRVILHYLRQFYKKEYGQVTDQNTLDGIKTIMVLVGEAAKKLDKYTQMFQQSKSVTDFKEYKQLQEFYRTKIARQIDDDVLSKWVLGLSLAKTSAGIDFKTPKPSSIESEKTMDAKYVFVDLDTVKKDTEYELFFIRKEDGSRFFSPRLLRNIKIVCDFGSYFGERKQLDPLEHVKEWTDRVLHAYSKEILKALGSRLNRFFNETRKVKDQEMVEVLKKALLALMMGSHAQNLIRHHPIKTCTEYFEDFQGFLRDAMKTTMYKKWMAYPPKAGDHIAHDLIDLIQTLCRTLYTNLKGLDEMKPVIQGLIHEASTHLPKNQTEKEVRLQKIWGRLSADYAGMSKLLKHHPNGPLLKVIKILEENTFHVFDPLVQHNLPNQLFDLYDQEHRYQFLRISAPVYQEFINKSHINEEFKGFLRCNSHGSKQQKHLLINLQDRTSWREHSRCKALEELQDRPGMKNVLTVVTLATDTDFYHQLSPYHEVNHADQFMEQFKELLLDDHAGYFFPVSIEKTELAAFIEQCFEIIHRVFFSSKNVLSREKRLDFIEIFYILLQLKLVEWIKPDSVSLTCKDSIDTGEAYSAELFTFLKLMQGVEWSDADWEHVNNMLYAPALLIRERVILPERFNRMTGALKIIEAAKDELGAKNFAKLVEIEFAKIFKTEILRAQILLPK